MYACVTHYLFFLLYGAATILAPVLACIALLYVRMSGSHYPFRRVILTSQQWPCFPSPQREGIFLESEVR
jgi:hypothetical protein